MKVLQLGKAYPPVNLGGVEVVIQLLAEGLNQNNILCDVLGVNSENKFKVEDGRYGGKIYRTKLIRKIFSTLLSYQLIIKLFKLRAEYQIIHIHSPDPMAALALLLVRPKCKIVLHWHSDILKQRFLLFFYFPILLWLLNRSDLILATSPNYIEGSPYLRKFRKKVEVLAIGIDYKEPNILEDSIKDKFFGKKIIFSLGRLAYYKGYEYLVKSMELLSDDYILIIAGEGSERKKLEKIIDEKKLKQKVFLMGKIDDYIKDQLFQISDVFVLSSIFKTEAFAIVQVEAMSYGIPIISTKIHGSGVDWVNKNNETGFIVPIKDPVAISSMIVKLFSSEDLLNKFKLNSKLRFNNEFTKKVMIDNLIKKYGNLLESNLANY